jgi:predicted transposase YbfD/YdcC
MTLISLLKTISDPRGKRGRRHELWLILFLSLLGCLCGYWGYRPLASFAREHHATWCELLELDVATTEVPSYSTFRQIFLQVDAQGWVDAFNLWAITHAPEYLGFFSVDGKSIKCTSSSGEQAGHDFASLVSVYNQSAGVIRLALMYNQKTSEIGVAKRLITEVVSAPELAASLPIGFSLDALHTQVDTLALLHQQDACYLIGLKANQLSLYQTVKRLTTQAQPLSVATEQDNTHGRQVQRTVSVYAVPDTLPQRWRHCGIARIVWVVREGQRQGKPFREDHYYLSNCAEQAAVFMLLVRNHWHIENGLHWVKDVTLKEDYPPRRGGQAPISWAVLNSFMVTFARRLDTRTVPDAMRLLANQVHKVFRLLT